MDEVTIHLGRVILSWCHQEEGTYGLGTTLESLWRRPHPMSPPYETVGVATLLQRLNQDSLFGTCAAARNLHPGSFNSTGGIETVEDLQDTLDPCAAV